MFKRLFDFAAKGLTQLLHGDEATNLQRQIEDAEKRMGDDAIKSPLYRKLVKRQRELEKQQKIVKIPGIPAP